MTSIGDIFDLPDGSKGTYHDEEIKQPEIKEKKARKKVEMSDEKKSAMLERLRLGREKRQENLKSKVQPKQTDVIIKEEVKKEVNKMPEEERLSFIKMMAGKSKPIEKVERPKKKVYEVSENKVPEVIKKEEQPKENKVQEQPAPISVPIVSAPVAIVKVPVVIRTFKKPIWA
jgi:hypothetical protein